MRHVCNHVSGGLHRSRSRLHVRVCVCVCVCVCWGRGCLIVPLLHAPGPCQARMWPGEQCTTPCVCVCVCQYVCVGLPYTLGTAITEDDYSMPLVLLLVSWYTGIANTGDLFCLVCPTLRIRATYVFAKPSLGVCCVRLFTCLCGSLASVCAGTANTGDNYSMPLPNHWGPDDPRHKESDWLDLINGHPCYTPGIGTHTHTCICTHTHTHTHTHTYAHTHARMPACAGTDADICEDYTSMCVCVCVCVCHTGKDFLLPMVKHPESIKYSPLMGYPPLEKDILFFFRCVRLCVCVCVCVCEHAHVKICCSCSGAHFAPKAMHPCHTTTSRQSSWQR